MSDGPGGEESTITTGELQRRRELLGPLVDRPSRACEYVDAVTDILHTELARSHTTVDAYVGKDAQSRELQETCAGILADVAEAVPESATTAVPTLARALSTADSTATREDAAEALMRIAEAEPAAVESAVGTLRTGLEDDAWEVRHHTAAALGEVPSAALALEGIVETLERLLDDENWLVRARAAGALWRLAERDADAVEPARPALFERLGDDEPRVRRKAGSAIAAVAANEPEAVALRLDGMARGDPDPAARAGAIRAVHGVVVQRPTRTALLMDTVIGAFTDEDERVRAGAVEVSETLARTYSHRRDELVDHLLGVLDDPDWTVPAEAADTLAVSARAVPNRVDEIVAALLGTLQHESALARHWCGKALATLLDEAPSTIDSIDAGLLDLMMDAEWEVVTSAALTLERVTAETGVETSVVDELGTIVRTDPERRRQAAQALAAVCIADPQLLDGIWDDLETFLSREGAGRSGTRQTRTLVAGTLLLGLEDAGFDPATGMAHRAIETLTGELSEMATTAQRITIRALAQPTTQEQARDLAPALETLAGGLGADHPRVRARAATGFHEAVERAPERVATYLDQLLATAGDEQADCRTAALDALGALAVEHPRVAPTCIDALGAGLDDPAWQVRSTAVSRLGEAVSVAPAPARAQLESVIELFLEPDIDIPHEAARTSIEIVESGAVGKVADGSAEILRRVLSDAETSDFVQTVAIELLARTGRTAARTGGS